MAKKKHHYIPVVYLRGFSENYPENTRLNANDVNIWIYDRLERRSFRKGLNNAFHFSHYYSFHQSGGEKDTTLEDYFSGNESNFGRISRILFQEHFINRRARCRLLENKDAKVALAYYLSLQLRRVPKFLRPTEDYIRKHFQIQSEAELRSWVNWSLADMGEGNHDHPSFHEILLNKNWTVFVILHPKKMFVSTDAPFSLFNSDGIGNDETEIWFPINQKILLHLHRPGNGLRVVPLYTSTERGDRLVDFMNTGIAQQSDRYIFSSSEVFLKSIVKRIDHNLRIPYAAGNEKQEVRN